MAPPTRKVFMLLFDIVFSNVIIAPLTVFYWKGTWELLDLYWLPDDPALSAWTNLAFSVGTSFLFYLFQQPLLNYAPKNTVLFFLLSRAYVYFFSLSSVGHWRAIWALIALSTDNVWLSSLFSITVGLFVLGVLRGLRPVIGPPFVVITDTGKDNFFRIPTLLDAQVNGACPLTTTVMAIFGFPTADEESLFLFDVVFSNIIIAPLAVFYWKGTWGLLDQYWFPDVPALSAWTSLVFSVGTSFLFYFFQQPLMKFAPNNNVLFFLLSRTYVYISSLSSVGHWRSVWALIALSTDNVWLSSLLSVTVGLFVLGVLRGLRRVIVTPFVVITDTGKENFFKISTLLNSWKKGNAWFMFDTFLTVVIVHSLVAAVWSGIWIFQDVYLLPNNTALSAFISLYGGYLLSFFIFASEKMFAYLSKKLDGNTCLRACVEDFYTLLMIAASIFIWRGIWNLQNEYWLEKKELSNWISHSIGFLGLTLIRASLVLPARGYEKDFSKCNGEGVPATVTYLKIVLLQDRENHTSTSRRDSEETEETPTTPLNGRKSLETAPMAL